MTSPLSRAQCHWGGCCPPVSILTLALTPSRSVCWGHWGLQGPCPECGYTNYQFFGEILTVQGAKNESEVKCENCKSTIKFILDKREIDLVEAAPQKK